MEIGSFGLIASLGALAVGALAYWVARAKLGMRWYWNAPGALLVSLWSFFVAWDVATTLGWLSDVEMRDTSKAALNTAIFAVGWYITAHQLPLLLRERRNR